MSKGSKRRPGNDKAFRENWDLISRKEIEKPFVLSKKPKKPKVKKKEEYDPFCFIKY